MRFRPCIDIHNGKVKQIVGGSLKDFCLGAGCVVLCAAVRRAGHYGRPCDSAEQGRYRVLRGDEAPGIAGTLDVPGRPAGGRRH